MSKTGNARLGKRGFRGQMRRQKSPSRAGDAGRTSRELSKRFTV
jgi:hypothetical protein